VFNRKSKPSETHELDETITNVIAEFAGIDAGTPEQTASAATLKILMDIRAADRQSATRESVSSDVLASGAASLLSIVMILAFEKANVITTKGLSFVPKMKS
jgi:hypothetical protein